VNAGFEYREQIGPQVAGRTVLAHLSDRYRHSSSSTWESRIGAGEVSLEGALAAATDILHAGDWLVWRRPPWEEPPVPLAFEVGRDGRIAALPGPDCRAEPSRCRALVTTGFGTEFSLWRP